MLIAERFDERTVAHMELAKPSLAEGLARCAASGASEVVVCPYFLGPGRHTSRDIPRLVSWYQDGRLKLNELVSRTYDLEGVNDALSALAASDGARGIIRW